MKPKVRFCTQILSLKNPKDLNGPRIRVVCGEKLSDPLKEDGWGNKGKRICPKCFSTYRFTGE